MCMCASLALTHLACSSYYCSKALGGCVTSQGVADSVDLDKHDNVAGEIQASMQVAADARQLIMETVIHLQVTLRQLSCAHAVLLSTAA